MFYVDFANISKKDLAEGKSGKFDGEVRSGRSYNIPQELKGTWIHAIDTVRGRSNATICLNEDQQTKYGDSHWKGGND